MSEEHKKSTSWVIMILNGVEPKRGQEYNLKDLACPYYTIFSEQFNIIQFTIRNTRDASNSFLELNSLDYKFALIIFVGHGIEDQNDYPDIVPFDHHFNLIKHHKVKNKAGTEITFKYIFDCCNSKASDLGKKKKHVKNITKHNIIPFLEAPWSYISIKKGQKNYKNDEENGTFLNESLLRAISNIDEKDASSWQKVLGVTNVLLRRRLKAAGLLHNPRWTTLLECDQQIERYKDDDVPVLDADYEDLNVDSRIPKNILPPNTKDLYDVPFSVKPLN